MSPECGPFGINLTGTHGDAQPCTGLNLEALKGDIETCVGCAVTEELEFWGKGGT